MNDEETEPIVAIQGEIIGAKDPFYHAFIIPSYKEDPELLGQTLQQIAKHAEAKNRYLVFLAMEAHEDGSVEKAKKLI